MPRLRFTSAALQTLAAFGPLALAGAALAATATGGGAGDQFAKEVLAEGLLFTYGVAFVKGLGAVVNPCVYPLIPITMSLIGARGAATRGHAIKNASIYVLGMALMYTALGVAAAGLGKLFGFTFQSTAVMGIVVVVFLAMGLSMLGAFELRLPAQWTERLTSSRGQTAKTFLMGMFSGIVAAPCTAPFVFSLLAYVSETQDMVLGASTLFVFSLGLGLPFLLLGIFSGALSALPKSGAWLVAVKYLFGAAMLGFALYYLPYAIGETAAPLVGGGLFVVLGIIGASKTTFYDWTDRAFKIGGVLVLLGGLALYGHGLGHASRVLFAPTRGHDGGAIAWLTDERAAIYRARQENKPVMLDFWATWCKGCKELEENALRDPRVVGAARNLVAARIDCTKETPPVKALYRKYGVQGLPALVFLDRDGSIRHDLIITEDSPAETVLERINRLR